MTSDYAFYRSSPWSSYISLSHYHLPILPMASPAPSEQFQNPPGYSFPCNRFNRVLRDSSKDPLVLVACGSFSPVTYLHLRMFEMARDHCRHNTNYEVVGGYLSPVSDQYKKAGLLAAQHRYALILFRSVAMLDSQYGTSACRLTMCNLAAEQTSNWLMVDPWEAVQDYQRTAVVLDHFEYEINTRLGGVTTVDGEQRPVRIMLLAGSDLIATMSEPGVWSENDVRFFSILFELQAS